MPRNKYEIGSDIASLLTRTALNDRECVYCLRNDGNILIKDLVALCRTCHKKFLLLVELQAC